MAMLIKVAETGDLQPGQGKRVEVQGKPVALFNIGGTFYAIDHTCTHRGGPLSEGTLQGESVRCPWHGSVFDLRTGRVLGPPATSPVQAYRVVVEGKEIKVEVQ